MHCIAEHSAGNMNTKAVEAVIIKEHAFMGFCIGAERAASNIEFKPIPEDYNCSVRFKFSVITRSSRILNFTKGISLYQISNQKR